jgi:hypothetical protein
MPQQGTDGAIYRSVILDTVNGLQNRLHLKLLEDDIKAGFDQWRDYGTEILSLYNFIKTLPDTVIVQVLGYEGTGKTVGGSTLDPSETVWLNTDGKPLSFFGARQKYPVDNSKKNYLEPTTYEKVKANIQAIHAKRKGTLIVFVNGHIEDYKGEDQMMRQRLKVLGKMATKLGIEGLNVSHTYYTKINLGAQFDSPDRYKLTVANSGANTARSPQGYWKTAEIPNNYQLIVNRILEDSGELEISA